jgi:1,4-alpha-glucan branching enzyme
MIVKHEETATNSMVVTFALPTWIWADTVCVVGDFNNWNTHATPMISDEENWHVTLRLPRGCRYQYRYLLDGCRWCNDCNAECYVKNVLGGQDSIVET